MTFSTFSSNYESWNESWVKQASDEFTKIINKRIMQRLFREKKFRDPKRYHSYLKHYLSKTLKNIKNSI